jgi:hypothetical protein
MHRPLCNDDRGAAWTAPCGRDFTFDAATSADARTFAAEVAGHLDGAGYAPAGHLVSVLLAAGAEVHECPTRACGARVHFALWAQRELVSVAELGLRRADRDVAIALVCQRLGRGPLLVPAVVERRPARHLRLVV